MKVYVINHDNEVEKTNLYDHVMESREETTTPKGVAPKYFVEKVEIFKDIDDLVQDFETSNSREDFTSEVQFNLAAINDYIDNFLYEIKEKHDDIAEYTPTREKFTLYGDESISIEFYTISNWGVGGNSYSCGKHFSQYNHYTEEEAENYLFNLIMDDDFYNDCNRSTIYFDTRLEATEHLYEVDEDTAKSIIHHEDKLKELTAKKKEREKQEREQKRKAAIERTNKLAPEYAKLIEPKNEPFKETARRLSAAIGSKIETKVFFAAVKLVRKQYFESQK